MMLEKIPPHERRGSGRRRSWKFHRGLLSLLLAALLIAATALLLIISNSPRK
jgi:hypothetical protein